MHELEADAHFDHIVPISRGGCNDVVNLQLLCESCNGAKRAELRPVRSSVPRYVKRRSKGVSAA
jgi:5-methylcytosine-specific restriction endonuclease McrA